MFASVAIDIYLFCLFIFVWYYKYISTVKPI